MYDNAHLFFEDLSKEEQTALRKSFGNHPKGGKALIIVAIVIAAVLVAVTILAIASKYMVDFITPSVAIFFALTLIVLRERRFHKWLKGEKGIIHRRGLKRKTTAPSTDGAGN